MSATAEVQEKPVKSMIPARMHDMPWSRFHWMVILGLGTAWILDGLEIQIVAAGGFEKTLDMSAADVGLAGTVYLVGEVVGALVFGRLTDTLGRKKMFTLTLAVYLGGSALAGLSPNMWWFLVFRFIAGMGIGGEYSAINSAIDELIPARVRGMVDLTLNGSYWLGTALGAVMSSFLLDPNVLGHAWGFRAAFGLGAVLAIAILLVRRFVPESPRWLMVRQRHSEALSIIEDIERECRPYDPACAPRPIRIVLGEHIGLGQAARVIFLQYQSRALLGVALMLAQAFFYNAIFFTYALTLTKFYDVAPEDIGHFLLPFALGNFLGPLVLGRLFDQVGRKQMIAFTYAMSGILLLLTGLAFTQGVLDATTHTLLWSVSFFFASAAASSAYLTVSEIFPLELRALAIALFYAVGTGTGGLIAPALFGALIERGSRVELFGGYAIAAALMVSAALVALRIGVSAERKALEDIAPPLSKARD
jgi:MFS family permease